MILVGVVIIGGGAFFAGTKYKGNSETPRFGNFPNMEQNGQVRMGQNNPSAMRAGQTGGMTMGEIISKDDISIIVKLPDGGSKIVFVTPSVVITKNVTGSVTDLSVGENVVVNGSANSDGSVNAQSIQLGGMSNMMIRPGFSN